MSASVGPGKRDALKKPPGKADLSHARSQAHQHAPLTPPSADADVVSDAECNPPCRGQDTPPGPAGGSREFLEQMLRRDPGSHVFVDLAEILCHEQQWSEAAELCRGGLRLHPRVTKARVILGWALGKLGDSQESLAILQEARRELEENAMLYRLLADMAASKGDADTAAHLEGLYVHLCPEGRRTCPATPHATHKSPSEPGEDRPESLAVPTHRDPVKKQADLLDALLRRFEGKQSTSPSTTTLFEDETRGALKRMLHGQGRS